MEKNFTDFETWINYFDGNYDGIKREAVNMTFSLEEKYYFSWFPEVNNNIRVGKESGIKLISGEENGAINNSNFLRENFVCPRNKISTYYSLSREKL